MGFARNQADEQEARRQVAIEIAVRVGLLKCCEDHHYEFDPLEDNFEDAYRLANPLISKGDPQVNLFNGDRKALTDLLQKINQDFGEACPGCEKREKE